MQMVVGDELPGNYHTLHRQAQENYGAWWEVTQMMGAALLQI